MASAAAAAAASGGQAAPPSSDPASPSPPPPVFNYILSFVLVGLAWGLTTPFIRAAARSHRPPPHPLLDSPRVRASWLRARLLRAFFAVVDLLRNPRYAVPLLLNLTGSVWFFLLIGQAGESRLSSLLFLFRFPFVSLSPPASYPPGPTYLAVAPLFPPRPPLPLPSAFPLHPHRA